MNELLIRTRFGILAHGVAGRQDMQLFKNERVIRTAEAVAFGRSTAAKGLSMATSQLESSPGGAPPNHHPRHHLWKNSVQKIAFWLKSKRFHAFLNLLRGLNSDKNPRRSAFFELFHHQFFNNVFLNIHLIDSYVGFGERKQRFAPTSKRRSNPDNSTHSYTS